ncbi:MAG: phenylalanine--tRNA ligase subunit beta, partial [Candidatus Liptonbacteria bacterium]
IIVRKARKGETIITLDDQKLELDPSVLTIADSKDPIAIAGIKGGRESGVTAKTKAIIVEAANFSWVGIQKTSRKLKLSTDASARFGHDISPALVDLGLDRATELLKEMGAVLKDGVTVYPHPAGDEVMEFSTQKYAKLIGGEITIKEAKEYFERLGFEVRPAAKKNASSETISVRIPAWRNDVSIPEDLIEEAARVKGYDTLKPQPPYVALGEAHEEDTVILKSRVREFLVRAQLSEAYLHSFIPHAAAEESTKQDYPAGRKTIDLENPMSVEQECLRPSLYPGLIEAAQANGRFYEDARLFEIGKVFVSEPTGKKGDLNAKETLHLGVVLARKKVPYFSELKGIASDLLSSFGITDISTVERGERLYIEADEEIVGYLEPRSFKKEWEGALMELDLDHVLKLVSAEHEFKPLPKFPAVVRDISLLCKEGVRIGRVLEIIQGAGANHVADADLLDEYTDEKLGGKQSLTFRVVFQAEDRTLTDHEVNKEFEKIVRDLKGKIGAEVR